jgi:hypothetical protein
MDRKSLLFAILLAVLLTAPPATAADDAIPAAARWAVQPLATVDLHEAPGLDRAALDREDLDRQAQGLPYRFASVQEVALDPSGAGTWESLPSGRQLWRLRVSGPDVLSLNLGFTRFWLPAGSRLLIYPAAGEGRILAYDETDNAPHGELWTPVLLTDEVVVELEIDPALRWQLELELTSVGRGYRFFGEDLEAKAGACNIDVICSQGDDWRDEIASVAVYSIGGGTICTGWMTNNTAQDGRPYFMTAYHCNVRANWASSLVVYWNFESPECGMQGGGSYEDTQSGSVLRAEWSTTDLTLLELDEVPDPAFGVRYAGWDRSDDVPTSAVAIHHPSTDEKSISFEDDPLTVTSYKSNISPGDGTHLRIGDWDEGTTEPGSSGSPLFNQDQYVVGQLHGGAAACGNNEPDWYGWFHVSWDGGGTDGSRLSNWLDPAGTGELTVETINPFGASFGVSPAEGFESEGIAGGPFDPDRTVYTLTNTGTKEAAFTAQVVAGWMSVTPESGSIPMGQSVDLTLTVAESASSLAVGRHRTTLEITNTTQGAGTTSRQVTLDVLANEPRITAVVPNPFGGPAVPVTEIRYTLGGPATVTARIHDIRGRRVRSFGNLAGVAGENSIVWDGRGDGNVGLPSGKYIFILEALGREEKTGIMLIH